MDTRLHGSSRIAAEFDAYGQVIVTEGDGKYSLRSRSSAGGVSRSILPSDDARSLGSADRHGLANGERPPPAVASADLTTPLTPGSPRYRRHSNADVTAETIVSAGGTVSSESSSLLRRLGRIGRRRRQDDESDSDTTTRYSDLSRAPAKRAGGRGRRRKNRRKKKHKGRSIDKHSDATRSRRHSASDAYSMDGPDNEYWRSLVAEQRRQSSLDVPVRHGRRPSSPRRRSVGSELSTRSPRMNGSTSVGTGSVSQFSGNELVRQSGRRRYSGVSRTGDRCERCGVVLPASIFIVVGCLLVIVGILRIFICFWHEFGGPVWTGLLLTVFGCVHVVLRRDYDKHVKTQLYIAVGVATSVAVLIAFAFSLQVLVPALSQVTDRIDASLDTRVLNAVNFSKYTANETLSGVDSVTWPSVVLDLCSVLLLTIALYSQTATFVAVDQYWECHFEVEGVCRYCGPPRLCNPFDQMSLGQATIFVGLLETTMMEYIPDHDSSSPHAWCMLWSGALLILAGFSGLCYGKRSNSTAVGVVSVTLLSCSLLGCAVTVVLTTLSIVKDSERLRVTVAGLQTTQSYSLTSLIALVVVEAICDLMSAVGVLFVSSNLFRQTKRLCHSVTSIGETVQQMSISSPSYHGRPQVITTSL